MNAPLDGTSGPCLSIGHGSLIEMIFIFHAIRNEAGRYFELFPKKTEEENFININVQDEGF